MYSMENQLKIRKVKTLHSLVQEGAATGAIKAMEQVLNPVERVRSFHSHKTITTDVVNADTRKYRIVKLWMWCAEVVERRGILRRFVSKKHSTHSLEVPQASTSTTWLGASEPLYFDDDGQLVCTNMVSAPHVN